MELEQTNNRYCLDTQVFSVDTMNPEEGDIILECDFKTELISHLLQRSGGRINVNVAPQYVFLLVVADAVADGRPNLLTLTFVHVSITGSTTPRRRTSQEQSSS